MRIFILSITLFLAPLLGACAIDKSTSDLALCKATVQQYAELRDDPEKPMEYSELFSPDGTFILGDTITKGRDALASRHTNSHANAVWKLETSDPKFKSEDGRIFAESRVTVLTGPNFDKLNTRIEAIYSDEFIILDGKCRIKTRHTEVTTRSPQ